MKNNFIYIILIVLVGCADKEYYGGRKYWVFIGEDFKPEYSKLKKGDIFGENISFYAGTVKEYGSYKVYLDSELICHFNDQASGISGSHFFSTNKGRINISGDLSKDLDLVIFRSVNENNMEVVFKKVLDKKINDFEFQLK